MHVLEGLHGVAHVSRVAPQHMLADGNEVAQQHKRMDDQQPPHTRSS
jgi:hypothetical protein